MSIILTAVLLARLPLVVRTYDSAGVSDRAFDHARQSASVTLAATGIDPIWRPCHASGCVTRPKPQEVIIRLVRATSSSERGSLGFAVVDVAQHTGTLATVYVDRVEALAAQARVDAGELLGRAMAHEIGHLILGTVDHAPFGLMRATWRADELSRDMPLDWTFSERQGIEMRRRLAARDEAAVVAESVVAEAGLAAVLDDLTAIWRRAKRLEPGATLTVTVTGAAPVVRYFVRLDSVELVVLNLGGDGLPKRQLINMTIDNPSWMAATSRTIYKDGNVRVGPDGVFVKDKKVADLNQVVERIPREKVVSLSR